MSATLNADMFAEYFNGCPTLDIPGRTFPVTTYYLEDALEHTGYRIEPGSECAKETDKKSGGGKSRSRDKKTFGKAKGGGRRGKHALMEHYSQMNEKFGDPDELEELYSRYPKHSQNTIESLAIVDECKINYDLIFSLLGYVSDTLEPKNGAILVFLSGIREITTLYSMLIGDGVKFGDPSQFVVHALHSSLSTAEQKKVFIHPPPGIRKIVIATNIAETSITIDDCICVIDAGRVKENRYDYQKKMKTLMEVWVSKASAKQRRGRAGRVRFHHKFQISFFL